MKRRQRPLWFYFGWLWFFIFPIIVAVAFWTRVLEWLF